MFKEVDKVTAITDAVKGLKVIRISEDDVSDEDQYIARDIRQEYLEFLLDDDKARFLVDDPDYKTPEPLVFPADEFTSRRELKEAEQIEVKADQTAPKADHNTEKADQGEPEADQAKKPGKTARKDVDVGKMQALHNAGWSIAKIADEMHVSASVVQRRLAEAARDK